MANDLLFSGMKKAGKKILRLLMLLWKNYGAGKPAAIQTRSLHRPWRIFPRLVFLIKPSEACSGVGVIELLSDGVMERGSKLALMVIRLYRIPFFFSS